MRRALCLLLAIAATSARPGAAADRSAFTARPARIPNYLPHMTWEEVADAVRRSDVVLVPLGSIEQHGPHLPLGSDIIAAMEVCLRIAERTGAVVAPVLFAGVSDYHLGFAGTISLSPATFEAVLFDTARSLVAHGFREAGLLQRSRGNEPYVAAVVNRINRETVATAVDLTRFEPPVKEPALAKLKLDFHAGVKETSFMLHEAPELVRMERAANPKLTIPPRLAAIYSQTEGDTLDALDWATAFLPEGTGKGTSTREMSSNGSFTDGDLRASRADWGAAQLEAMIAAGVRFIEQWKAIEGPPSR
jgi:creatinine amidohydrolase